jgi:hypothetical protein
MSDEFKDLIVGDKLILAKRVSMTSDSLGFSFGRYVVNETDFQSYRSSGSLRKYKVLQSGSYGGTWLTSGKEFITTEIDTISISLDGCIVELVHVDSILLADMSKKETGEEINQGTELTPKPKSSSNGLDLL